MEVSKFQMVFFVIWFNEMGKEYIFGKNVKTLK